VAVAFRACRAGAALAVQEREQEHRGDRDRVHDEDRGREIADADAPDGGLGAAVEAAELLEVHSRKYPESFGR
jgi:hypothetical protein